MAVKVPRSQLRSYVHVGAQHSHAGLCMLLEGNFDSALVTVARSATTVSRERLLLYQTHGQTQLRFSSPPFYSPGWKNKTRHEPQRIHSHMLAAHTDTVFHMLIYHPQLHEGHTLSHTHTFHFFLPISSSAQFNMKMKGEEIQLSLNFHADELLNVASRLSDHPDCDGLSDGCEGKGSGSRREKGENMSA